jgi:hypothetical protein
MADLIAIGLYQAVRAGGGPIVPVRAGRVDAALPGLNGIPVYLNRQIHCQR